MASTALSRPARRALYQLVRHAAGTAMHQDMPAVHRAALPDHLVRRHALAPLAFHAGVARFHRDFIASALFAELRETILCEVIAALADQAIPVILLKGISYAGALYPDPAQRPMSDIDLMVPPALHDRAARVLGRLGYWIAGSHRQRSPMHHAVCFKREHAAIDLHRSIIQPLRSRIDIDGLWQRARPARERADGALRLDPIDEAVIHLAHIARHELRVPLINYVDAARLLAHARRGAVVRRAREFRLSRAIHAVLAMTAAVTCGRPLRPAVLPSSDEILACGPIPRPIQLARKLSLVDGPRELIGLAVVGAYGYLAQRFRA